MFADEEENYEMLIGSYKKLKSYYYYNKNFLFMRKKIASFEFDNNLMEKTLRLLAKILKNPSLYESEIHAWINLIDYYVLPKAYKFDNTYEERFVSSTICNKSVSKVNFFINMPIELHLLETVWALYISKMAYDSKIIRECSFGNSVDEKILFKDYEEELSKSINFMKNKFFKIYFSQYCEWKNRAIQTIEKNKKDKSTLLVSLDIKSFYYSVRWKFNELGDLLNDRRIEQLKSLTQIMEEVFLTYTKRLKEVRELSQDIYKGETVLPIGLFSSMILANVYLSSFDQKMLKNDRILYYGRYVDDMILVMNVSQTKIELDDAGIEEVLKDEILDSLDRKTYSIHGYKDLIIQKDKMKVIYFECGKSDGLIANLKKTKIVPSQMNVVPMNDIQLQDFEEAAYAIHNFTNETKIRDIGQLEVDRFKLAMYMSGIVRNSRYRLSYWVAKEEKRQRQIEKNKIIKFFEGINAVEYNSNWINALYYFLLNSTTDKRDWNKFEEQVRTAIRKITIKQIDSIKKGKERQIKARMKQDLSLQFDICVATALAINPRYSKKEKKEILDICIKIRKANLFNHYLLSFPLINYCDDLAENIDLSNMKLNELETNCFEIQRSNKMRFSPRFINYDELFLFALVKCIVCDKNWHLSEGVINNIRKLFFKVNNINLEWAKPLCISVEEKRINEYMIQQIQLYGKNRRLDKVRIAVANIKLDINACCMGLNETAVARSRKDFLNFLSESYSNGDNKVDYLVFPEFYLPLSWMQDVLSFSRKTGITVITGIQYVTKYNYAHNLIGVFAQMKSGKYSSSCVIVREKNNYAPLEKKILATEGYYTKDKETPLYTHIDDGGVRLGTFLCYEFTDICARSLFKNNTDVVFIPENNSDTNYFSNIVETMTRDLHAFMVQANTSIYGDSRISGPYSRDYRNVVQIKGGDNDSLIIGTINIQSVIKYRDDEKNEMQKELDKIFNMSPYERKDVRRKLIEHSISISRSSARTFF